MNNILHIIGSSFRGRLSRSEFIKSAIAYVLCVLIFTLIFMSLLSLFRYNYFGLKDLDNSLHEGLSWGVISVGLVCLLYGNLLLFGLMVRRLRDIADNIEFCVVGMLIPYLNIVLIFFLLLKKSKDTYIGPKRNYFDILFNRKSQ